MKTPPSLLPLLTALVTLLGDSRATAAAKPAEAHLPLAEGVEWTMNFEMTLDDGRRFNGTARRVVGAPEMRDGKTYFRVRTWVEVENMPRQERVKLSRKDATGFHTVDLTARDSREEPEVVLPLKVGAQWKTKFLGAMALTHEVKAVETIVVGGKTYADCYRIQSTAEDGSYVEFFWEAPGVGSVKSEMRFQGGKSVLTLREFKAGKSSTK